MKTNITVKLKIYNETKTEFEEIELIVDTGSTYTWVNENLLKQLNIKSIGSHKFHLITGEIIDREIGGTWIEYDGIKKPTTLVFAKKSDANVLGLVGLEELGLDVDTETKTLKKREIFLAYNSKCFVE